jgi:hypothetical protein
VVFDFGQLPDGRQYCVMERLHGRTLRALIDDRGTGIPLAEALPMLRGIAEAVDAAHAGGIAHRDLKPDNVFILPDGSPKLIDFGLAKLTQEDASVTTTGTAFGTPLYMSPEQCRGRGITLATDAYSFGVLAFHVLTGKPPFGGAPLEIALAHLNDSPPSSNRGTPVDRVLHALLAKDAALRPASLVEAVEALARGSGLGRRRWPIVLGAVAAAIAATLFVVLALGGDDAVQTLRGEPLAIDNNDVTSPHLTPEGDAIVYSDDDGPWRYDLSTKRVTRPWTGAPSVPIAIDPLPRGRYVFAPQVGDVRAKPGMVELVDASGSRTPLFEGSWPTASPDGSQILALQREWLVVYDVSTRSIRKLVDVGALDYYGAAQWSPDGTRVIWTPTLWDHRLRITRVADGQTEILDVSPVAASRAWNAPAAFLDDRRIVYCGMTGTQVSLRVRDLEARRERVLRELDPEVSVCSPMIAKDRMALVTLHGRSFVASLDLSEQTPAPRARKDVARVGDRDTTLLGFDRLGRHYVVRDKQVVRTDVLTGETASLPSCGERRVEMRADQLLHLRWEAGLLTATDDACREIERWKLTSIRVPNVRCSVSRCFAIAIVDDHHARIYELQAGRAEAELVKELDVAKPNQNIPRIEISPDSRRLAITTGDTHALVMLDLADRSIRSLEVEELFTAVWTSDTQLAVAANSSDRRNYFVARLSLDGTYQVVWSSMSSFLGIHSVVPGTQTVVGLQQNTRATFEELRQN